MSIETNEQQLVEWLARKGWRFTVSDGGRTAVAHGTVRTRAVVVTGSGRNEDEALRHVLAAVAAQSLA